jgi:hypothetical protein
MNYKIGHGNAWRIETCKNTYDWIIAVDRGIPCEQHIQVVSYHPDNTPSAEYLEKFLEDNRDGLQDKINMFVDAANQAGKEFGYEDIETFAVIFKYSLLKYIINNALNLEYANLLGSNPKPVDDFPRMCLDYSTLPKNSKKEARILSNLELINEIDELYEGMA